MSFRVVFRPQAQAEFEEALAWYEDRTRGLGQEFVTCVQATIESIRRDPGTLREWTARSGVRSSGASHTA